MGFFFDEGGDTTKRSNASIPLETAKKLGCQVCTLKKSGAYHPDMPPWGSEKPVVYFLGEAPGELEDKENRPFIGKSGQLLQQFIPKRFDSHYRLNNTVRTRPPANRAPTELELTCCRRSVEADIIASNPRVLVVVGSTALNWLFEGQKQQDIAKWRGRFFPVQVGTWMGWAYCIYHPSYILRGQRTDSKGNPYKTDLDYLFERDMQQLFDGVSELPAYVPVQNPLQGVVFTEGLKSDRELDKVLGWLDQLVQEPLLAIDYETTGIRPFYKDSKILTVAIGTDKKSYAFPIRYPNAWNARQLALLEEAFKDFLLHSGSKIAHNTKFELEWSATFFGEEVLYDTQWEDTQAQAYVLDERKGTHNLDTLIRLHFGFWLKDLSPMDKSNMIEQPLSKILPYNAMDTKWTFALYQKQLSLLAKESKLEKVYSQLIPMMVMLTQIQLRGLAFDDSARQRLKDQYGGQLAVVEKQIQDLDVCKEYKTRFNQPFNPSSPAHVTSIFKNILNVEDRLRGESGKLSTDESILSRLTEFPLAKLILEYRGLAKKISTYVDAMPQYIMPDGRIHTTYNPYETTTGRLCVVKGTLVAIMDWEHDTIRWIPIEEVTVEHWALSYKNGYKVGVRKVLWSGKTGVKQVMRLCFQHKGTGDEGHLDLTCNHPILMKGYQYKRADALVKGDVVLGLLQQQTHALPVLATSHEVTSISWLDGLEDVYDLEVEDTHNFVANGVAISNSSDSPNLQNLPSKTGKEPRGMFCAPKGHVLVCCDYGQIEARLIGAASQDANFCAALWDNYDVHMEWAKKIADTYPAVIGGRSKLDDAKALKAFRSKVKNLWVFPAFYGASYKSISAGIGVPVDLTEELFDEFWDQFSGVRKWQRWLLQRYNKLGYVESLFGRRRHAPLTANAVYNSPIQGSASDICVLSMVALNALGLNVVLNVHDEIGFYVPENELEDQIDYIVREMTRPKIPWLNIPISVEVKIGKNWFEMEEVLTVDSTDFYVVNRDLLNFTTLYDQ